MHNPVLFRTDAFGFSIVLMECLAAETITTLCKVAEGANPKVSVQKHVLFSAARHVGCLAGAVAFTYDLLNGARDSNPGVFVSRDNSCGTSGW